MNYGIVVLGLAAASWAEASGPKLQPGHDWVYLQVRVTDTQGKGISQDSLKIKLKRFVAPGRRAGDLLNVEPLRNLAGAPSGVYSGRVPIDSEDELWLQEVVVEPVGYRPTAFLPTRLLRNDTESRPDDGNGKENSPYRFEAAVARDYAKWRPRFDEFNTLPESVRTLLQNSTHVEYLPVSNQGQVEEIGKLAGHDFDRPRARRETNFRDAKAGLLNIVAVLQLKAPPYGLGKNWRFYVKELRRFNEERIVVAVKPELFDLVTQLSKKPPSHYNCDELEPGSATWHGRSFYNLLVGNPRADVVSVKLPLCQGNLQATVCRFRDPVDGKVLATFADFDIDQNRGVAHWWDAATQHNRSPTNPMLVFDMLGGLIRQGDWNIGYRLELSSAR